MNRMACIRITPDHIRYGTIRLLDEIDYVKEKGGDLETLRRRVMDDGLCLAREVQFAIMDAYLHSPAGKELMAAANRGFGYAQE